MGWPGCSTKEERAKLAGEIAMLLDEEERRRRRGRSGRKGDPATRGSWGALGVEEKLHTVHPDWNLGIRREYYLRTLWASAPRRLIFSLFPFLQKKDNSRALDFN